MDLPNRYLFTFAAQVEARPFETRVRGDRRIRVLLTGIGPRPAAVRLRKDLEIARPDVLLSCGFAGALAPELEVGAVVYSADDTFPPALALTESGARPARFLCSPRVLVSAEAKKAARDRTGADAVEMESEVLRRIAAEVGIPSATVRVISDVANEDLALDFNRLLDDSGQLRTLLLIRTLLAAPGRIPRLLRFQRRLRTVAERLAETLIKLMPGDDPKG